MSVSLQYRLNTDELSKILIEKGWGIEELSEASKISRTHFYRMSLSPDNKNFSPVGFEARKKLRMALPDAKSIFLPINVRSRTKED
jgi:hypothetical protein